MDAKMAIEAIEDVLSSVVNYDESLEYQLTTYDIDWLEEAKRALKTENQNFAICWENVSFTARALMITTK